MSAYRTRARGNRTEPRNTSASPDTVTECRSLIVDDRAQAIAGTQSGLLVTTHRDIIEQPIENVAGLLADDPFALIVSTPGQARDARLAADVLQRIQHPHRVVRRGQR